MARSASLLAIILRRLRRAPVFTTTAVVTLALGIGANLAIFSIIRGVLLKPLPYPQQERLVAVWNKAPARGFDQITQSMALHLTLREQGRAFESLALWNPDSVTITGLERAQEHLAIVGSPSYLPMLGARAELGRLFSDAEESPEAPPTVVLSHGFWQSRLGGKSDILGTTLRIDGVAREVVGVLASGFRPPHHNPDLYLPLTIDRSNVIMGQFNYHSFGRLAPGETLESASAEMERLIPVAAETFPGGLTASMLEEVQFGPALLSLRDDVVGDVGRVLWVLLGTVGLVLLIACANVANLFLVRAEEREREIAVRTALGAGRLDVARDFLSESLALALLGGALGVGLARGALALLVRIGPGRLPRLHEISIDGVVLAFALGQSLVTALLFGSIPAMRLAGRGWATALKEGGRGGSAGRQRHRLRRILVAVQVGLALVLLVGSGLMLRSFRALRHVEPGYREPQRVQRVRIGVPSAEVKSDVALAQLYRDLGTAMAQLPGVESVGFSSALPFDDQESSDAVMVEDFPTPEGQLPPVHAFMFVSPGYLSTIGNALLAGRDLEWRDVEEHRPVAVVSANLARKYWGAPERALGKRLGSLQGEGDGVVWREIVGVTGDLHHRGLDQEAPTIIFWPYAQRDFWGAKGDELFVPRSVGFALRSERAGSRGLVDEIQRTIEQRNPNLPLVEVQTLADLQGKSLARTSFTMTMLGVAAATALLLGAIGIYGVVAYIVAQRTREIGVRMALGARRSDVSRQVVAQGMWMALLGVAVGLGAALLLTRWMAALLYGVPANDPMTFVGTACALAAVSCIASWLAAHRATRVDPVVALRAE